MILLKIIKNKYIKETIWSIFAKLFALIGFFVLQLILTRSLSTEDFGKWNVFIAIFVFITSLSYQGINGSIRTHIVNAEDKYASSASILAGIFLKLIVVFRLFKNGTTA